MYVSLQKKRFVSFILIFVFLFFSFTVPFLEAKANAEVVTATLTAKALIAIVAAIGAGAVFTDSKAVDNFGRSGGDFLLRTGGLSPGLIKDVEDHFRDKLQDLYDQPSVPGRPIKPPKPPSDRKNNLTDAAKGISLGAITVGIVDYIHSLLYPPDTIFNNSLAIGSSVFSITFENNSNLKIFLNGKLLFNSGLTRPDNYFQFTGSTSVDKLVVTGTTLDYANVTLHYTAYKGGGKPPAHLTYQTSLYFSSLDSDTVAALKKKPVSSTIIPSVSPPISIPGVDVPAKLPTKKDIQTDKGKKYQPGFFPIPFPTVPNLPGTEVNDSLTWQDFGFDVYPDKEIVFVPNPTPGYYPDGTPTTKPDGTPNPNPNYYPDGTPNPNPSPIPSPGKFPKPNPGIYPPGWVDIDTGVSPDEFVNMDKNGLQQWLDNRVYNFENTTNIVNNNGGNLDIEDDDFDRIDFDFSPLKDVGTALVTRFPFCIPFDLVDSISLLSGKGEPPKFLLEFIVVDPFKDKENKEDIEIDFAQFEKLALISRIFFTLIFIVILAFGTSKVIKW